MNYDDIVNSISLGEKIYNLPLRVTYYARVSTSSDVQLNSLDNQLLYYEKYITSNKNWNYVKGYVEEGVTGVRVDKRIIFQEMINDASKGKFDLIITKEVSRFARDLEDSIHYIRLLKKYGVGIYFENQNLNTFDSNSELILNIMFNLAQEESRKLSSRIKFGHKQAIQKGHVLGSNNIIGYKKDNCKLVVVEEEAKLIQTIFELYASGEYGFYKLAKELFKMGYLNKKGKIYDKDTIKRIIKNPKYKGYFRGHTFEIMDYRTKRRKTIPLEEQIIYKTDSDVIPQIVSEELWNKANEVLNTRTKSYKNNNCWSGGLKYPFSSKIFCSEHNTNYQRNKKGIWSCGMYTKYRIDACISPLINECDLIMIFNQIINKVINNKEQIINNFIKLYEDISINNNEKEIEIIDKKLEIIENKKNKALDLIYDDVLNINDLKHQFKEFEKEINLLNRTKKELLCKLEMTNKDEYINNLYKCIEDELNNFSEEFIKKFVDEIIVYKINNNRKDLRLEIYLNMSCTNKTRIKGARHIKGKFKNEKLFLENKKYITNKNQYTYNVYM